MRVKRAITNLFSIPPKRWVSFLNGLCSVYARILWRPFYLRLASHAMKARQKKQLHTLPEVACDALLNCQRFYENINNTCAVLVVDLQISFLLRKVWKVTLKWVEFHVLLRGAPASKMVRLQSRFSGFSLEIGKQFQIPTNLPIPSWMF